MTLPEFLDTRLDESEAAGADPAALAAWRSILEKWRDRYEDDPSPSDHEGLDARDTLQAIALVYSDHADYDRRWYPALLVRDAE